jgi:hypothetical protein
MSSNNTSSDVSGPRKRKLSTKASTNGDPLEAKRKKTLSGVKKGGAAALTKKKATPVTGKATQKQTTVDNDNSDEAISISDDDDKVEDETNLETAEESAEAELGRVFFFFYLNKLITSQLERLSKEWTSPIYVFFRKEPRIENVNGRRVHVFECAAGRCRGKNGRDVRRFLDTGDAKSTSGLRRHAKNCWGDDAVEAADGTQDLDGARLVLTKTKLRDGSITAQFERIGKTKVTYSHRQHTTMESR